MKKTALLASTLAVLSSAHAYEAVVKKGQLTPSLESMISKVNSEARASFAAADFAMIEDRELATSRFKMYVQTHEYIPVDGTAIRIWTDKTTGELILGEMHLDEKSKLNEAALSAKYHQAKFSPSALKSSQLEKSISSLVASEVSKHSTDSKVYGLKYTDKWVNGDLVRQVEVRGRRGMHHISVSLLKNRVIEKIYIEFPQSESMTLKANIFPMYEEVEGTSQRLPYEVRDLKYVNTSVRDAGDEPFANLEVKMNVERYHPVLAETEVGQQYDFWSHATIRRQVEQFVAGLPSVPNSYSNGVLLQGKYATINLHPEVKKAFPGINFDLKASYNHQILVEQRNGAYVAELISTFFGKPITSEADLLARIPERLPDHNPTAYINSGVDEAQVYYAVTTLMESLAGMGFTDPELSTKPFHAMLYDPDIGMKDNAYYTDDTINFTTYNPGSPNLARDNPTIWHELGHGVMDRLMGGFLGFADSKGGYGGLSEGMADFVAKLIVEEQTAGADFPGKFDFRIMNNTGLYLTNEFHDDGESYGGAMNDMLSSVVSKKGKLGLVGFADLTLEAMRLTRNHPALSARSWFEHMLYADELGSSRRASGEYASVIKAALASRNFSFSSDFRPATMKVTFGSIELTNESAASREKPIEACDADGAANYTLKVSLTEGDTKFIKFPATVKVEYKKGALQGAIAWKGEESNPTVYEIASEGETLDIPLEASMKCETINQPDGSCKDYAYIQVFNPGSDKPAAKKRFYLKVNPNASCR